MKSKNIQSPHLQGDFFGGLTTGLVALPLALAFGVQSGMGAFAGLYAAIAIGMLAAWFGGTATLISGPTAPMTVVSAIIIATAIETNENLSIAMGTIVATFMLAGVFQLFLGLLKSGQYIRHIPYPVISGFISGIGVLLIVLQVFPFLGHPSPQKVADIFVGLPGILSQINYSAVGLAGSTIAIIYLFPKLSKVIPSSFVALILATAASKIMGLDVTNIGNIAFDLPVFKINTLSSLNWFDFSVIILPALTLAVVGAIDTLLTSVVVDKKTKTKHNSNKEMIGQGLGNMLSAAIGGIPGAGATMRSIVNINAGGRSRISGVIHSTVLLIILFFTGNYAELIPLPVLAGILVTVGIDIINYKEIKQFIHAPRTDAVIMLMVLSLTVFIDLFQAVAIGLVMALILFMKKISVITEDKPVESYVKDFTREKPWADEVPLPEQIQNKVFIQHFDNVIFLEFSNKLIAMTQSLPEVEIVIMRMKRVRYIDQTGVVAIKKAIIALQDKNRVVLITEIQHQPMDMLKKSRIIPHLIPEKHIFLDFNKAIQMMEENNLMTFVNKEKNVPLKELNVQNVT
mgnify:CR=1 FL=1